MKNMVLLFIILLFAGCTEQAEVQVPEQQVLEKAVQEVATPSEEVLMMHREKFKLETPAEMTSVETPAEMTSVETPAEVDLSTIDLSLKPNELGEIMVLMYHNVGEKESDWVRSEENFKKDLATLYSKGYRPLALKNYVRGHIDTPAGYTPIVITVDDAQRNNFYYLEDGSIDPHCFVGILLDFQKEHPDFPLHVSFFATGPYPFGQEGYEKEKIHFLIQQGMDIGNHSRDHVSFRHLSGEELQESIGAQAAFLESLAPEGYKVNTLALPYGSHPDDALEIFLQKGSFQNHHYENIAILNVGWDPWYSPFHKDFTPFGIHRVTASELHVDGVGLYDWLRYFDEHPEQRFISDGNPAVVTIPSTLENQLLLKEDLLLNSYTP